MANYIPLPGVPCTPGELRHPNARALARAIEKRPYFTLIECRHCSPDQLNSNPNQSQDNEEAMVVRAYAAMSEQKLDDLARQIRQQNTAAKNENQTSQVAPSPSVLENDLGEQIGEFVIFEVSPDIPQYPVHEIEVEERLAALFISDVDATQWSNEPPLTLVLRTDFPIVPHLNARSDNSDDHLLALCLWDEPHQEVELKWTPALHLERVWQWLRKTARGELHALDQPLEPLFFAAPSYLLVPPAIIASDAQITALSSQPRFRGRMVQTGKSLTFVADNSETSQPQVPFAAIVLEADPQTHGVIKHPPRTLGELQTYCRAVGLDILGAVREQLKEWMPDKTLWNARIVFVLKLPSRRTDTSAPEKYEFYGFATAQDMVTLGITLGVWEWTGQALVPLIGHNDDNGLTPIFPLNVAPLLERQKAQLFNAQTPLSTQPTVVAIGAGAIGSQVFMNLARSGWGRWTVADGDIFLPHNGARNVLDGEDLGKSKAQACCAKANSLCDDFGAKPIFTHFTGRETPDSPLAQALEASDLVLDFSASVSTARTLADVPNPCARRISIFLNPAGTQMLILAEDSARAVTLTDLEMQLWRAIVTDASWGDYYDNIAGERVRYARSCGDVSARLPQDFVALHSAGASRVLRQIVQSDEGALMRWTLNGEIGEVRRSQWPLSPMREWEIGDWKVRTSEDTMSDLWEMRDGRLPLETGGILLGVFDSKRKIAHLVAALPAPPDSQECHDSFLRGHEGLREAKERAETLSGGTVSYLGEWHSHPNSYDATPSAKDYNNFNYLKAHREADGLPPIMLILADKGDCNWFVGEMPPPLQTSIVLICLR